MIYVCMYVFYMIIYIYIYHIICVYIYIHTYIHTYIHVTGFHTFIYRPGVCRPSWAKRPQPTGPPFLATDGHVGRCWSQRLVENGGISLSILY